jgi:hypothetical protein
MYKKAQNIANAINSYYAAAVIVYGVVIYVVNYIYSHNYNHLHFLIWIPIIIAPFIGGWSGYLLKSYLDQRNQRYGFKTISDSTTYEIAADNKYILHSTLKLQAASNYVMMYPFTYKWSGKGTEGIPKVTGKGQTLLALQRRKNGKINYVPYEISSTQGAWHTWFIAINPPIHKGDKITIEYSQELLDKKGSAQPNLWHVVNTPIDKLELKVQFPPHMTPTDYTSSYTKPSDQRRPYIVASGARYDVANRQIIWTIQKPKLGYYYSIDWKKS